MNIRRKVRLIEHGDWGKTSYQRVSNPLNRVLKGFLKGFVCPNIIAEKGYISR